MAEANKPECQLRRRRSSGNPNLPLNLDVGYQVSEGGPSQGTPSPSCVKFLPNSREPRESSSAHAEFRKKQQSFDIQVELVEECEEEEIIMDSDDDGEEPVVADRPITPTPIQDFAANVTYKEGPQHSDFLKVNTAQAECLTDVSDADSDGEE
ncbi:hypothetical protein JYU34_003725 [Plutella xylostella]|uniref:Uncharacterized protein n=1 Tax=Plutella xylostella TaxID=51655 RepID=A0ABQ7R0S8_PLUXY|nr:uncharacterized protein LOC105389768 isoform X2 [Plutella xylostella]KAG7310893.1 hypothetical protein JYU34_003725 [Plutella xylostella]